MMSPTTERPVRLKDIRNPLAPGAFSRATFWSFTAALLTIAGLLALVVNVQYRDLLQHWAQRQSSIADDRTRLVSNWLLERIQDARNPYLATYVSGMATSLADRQARAYLLDLKKEAHGYLGIYLLDSSGRVLAQAQGSQASSPQLEAAARRTVESGLPRLEWFLEGSFRGRLLVIAPVDANVKTPGGHPLGAIALIVDPHTTLFPLLTSETVPTRTGETVLVARDGHNILYLSPLRYGPKGFHTYPARETLAAEAALQGHNNFGRFTDYRGRPVLAAVRKIPGTDLALIAKIDTDEAFAVFATHVKTEIVCGVLLLLSVAGWFFGYKRYVSGALSAARESEFRALLESTPDGLVILDAAGRIALVNSRTVALFGYASDELIGQCVAMLAPDFSSADVRAGSVIESVARRKDGTAFPLELSFSVVIGKPGSLCVAVRDITERKRIEKELNASELRYRRYIERNAAGFIRTTPDGRLVECNDAAVRMLDYDSQTDLKSSSIYELYRDPNERHSVIETLRSHGCLNAFEVCLNRKDHSPVWALVNLTLTTVDDQPVIEGTLVDITERKRIELELRKIAAVVEASDDFIGLASMDGEVQFLNQAARRFAGLSPDGPLAGTHILDYISESEHQNVNECVMPQMMKEGRLAGEMLFRNMKTGAVTPMWQSSFFITEPQTGRRIAMATICRDLTERKKKEEDLRAARHAAEAGNHAKSRFLAMMSHEIRTPMNGIMGMVRLLLASPLSGEQRHHLEVVLGSAKNLLALMNQILDLSKIEAGKVVLERLSFSVRLLLESATEGMAVTARRKGLDFTCVVEPDVPRILLGDPARLRQVIANLATNAVKFTSDGSVRIVVSVDREEERSAIVRFTVTDTGIGIPPEQSAHLFSPFVQGDESTTRKFGGTGLGLSISKQLVELMHGAIGSESTPGRGSSFWFTACLEKGLEDNAPAGLVDTETMPSRAVTVEGREAKLLVAEDHPVNREVVIAILKHLGYQADIVQNGQEAVTALKRQHYDLVLMDCEMPEMDGYEATRRIRDPNTGALDVNIPIVALTASAMAGDRERCIAAGMDDYLSKPIEPRKLAVCLVKWLGKRGGDSAPFADVLTHVHG